MVKGSLTPAPEYPLNISELEVIHSNYVATFILDNEIYLDICQLQPHQAMADALAKGVNEQNYYVPAVVKVRIVISKDHVKQMMKSLSNLVESKTDE